MMGAPKEGTPEAVGTAPGAENQKNQHLDCLTGPDRARKNFLTLQVRSALAGYALHELADRYLFCGRARSRQLPDLRVVAAVLLQIGGRHV